MSRFEMKKPPIKPIRKQVSRVVILGTNLKTCLKAITTLKDKGINLEECWIKSRNLGGSGYKATYYELQTNEEFEAGQRVYRNQLREYNQWKEKHYTEIGDFLEDEKRETKKRIEAMAENYQKLKEEYGE